MLAWPFVHHFPVDFPEVEWLASLAQLLEYDCEAFVAQEARVRKQSFRLATSYDEQHNHSRQGFHSLKKPSKPPFQAISAVISQAVQKAESVGQGEYLLRVPRPQEFRIGCQVMFEDAEGLVVSVDTAQVHVAFGDELVPPEGTLVQEHGDCTARELHCGFKDFWEKYWSRDSLVESLSLDSWEAYQAIIARYPKPWPELAINMLDTTVWQKVIRRARKRSATGACGFAVSDLQLLPPLAITHLSKLCDTAKHSGFPSFMVTGRVNVLAKVEDPTGFQDGRPICVLPVLYRTWGSVLCAQLLDQWGTRMPSGIFGGLPGRSARDISYLMQHRIEVSIFEDSQLSGFVLDIIKCFNALPRQPLLHLLTHVGCPEEYANFWMSSLQRMGRASSFVGDVSAELFSTTGLPEGDAMSVAGILALCWLCSTMLQDHGLEPMLFVDNWSWVSEVDELHTAGLQVIQDLTSALRIRVDWGKSFAWSRHPEGSHWWRLHGEHILPPDGTLQLLASAKDLGTAMRYRSSRALGCLRARFEEGHRRLKVLASQPRTAATKARLIQTSIWPACFYGSEGHLIGLKHHRGLRTAAARALVGAHHHVAPHVALSMAVPGVQDPELFAVLMMLRAWRRAWHIYQPLAQSVLDVALQSPGTTCQAVGPGTALKATLVRLGWSLNGDAWLSCPGHVKLHLPTASNSQLNRYLLKAWAFRVRDTLVHRNGLAGLAIPDPVITSRALGRFTASQQKVLVKHVSGAFQTAAMKSRWDHTLTDSCPWCGQPETRRHRFLECSAFQTLRMHHADAVDLLSTTQQHWIYCPVATLPEADDILSLIFATRPPPGHPLEAAARLKEQAPASIRVFTDGTCVAPQFPAARHAAWAVVLDCASTDEQRRVDMDRWCQFEMQPPSLQVWAQGLVAGAQTTPRAELYAALQAVRLGYHAGCIPLEVVTDCSYVVHLFALLAGGMSRTALMSSANMDILLLLQEVWYEGIEVRKVRSHQQVQDQSNLALAWHVMGNIVVDLACDAARGADLSIVHELQTEVHRDQRQQLHDLSIVFEYYLALHTATNRMRHNHPCAPSTLDVPAPDEPEDGQSPGLAQWCRRRSQQATYPALPQPAPSVFHACTWGYTFASNVWTWANTLQWFEPTEDEP